MKKTKIIATLGPASSDINRIHELIITGVDVFRINLSHGDHQSQADLISAVKTARKNAGTETAILLDTRGPEIRTTTIPGGHVDLENGKMLFLTTLPENVSRNRIGINYNGLAEDLSIDDEILLDDGKLALKVVNIDSEEILTKIIVGGRLGENKRVSLPGLKVNLPALTEKDIDDIRFGIRTEVDFIAASFVRKAKDVLEVRKIIEKNGGKQKVIAKIENQEGVDNLHEILEVSDGLMVARGDLGVELQPERVPLIQKEIIQMANRQGKPVITATQMLESMINNPRPTRAEASDVANAIFDGSDAVMLSAETAVGNYPLESVRFLVKNAEVSETALSHDQLLIAGARYSTQTVSNSICYAACAIANELDAHAVLVATQTGYTARMISRHRPQPSIIAISSEPTVRRQMQLVWGVQAIVVEDSTTINKLFNNTIQESIQAGLMKHGDMLVLVGGLPYKISGSTNMLKIHEVGDISLYGQGIGKASVTAEVTVVNDSDDLDNFKEGNILVTDDTNNSILPILLKLGGIITEQAGFTTHAAIIGREKNIPVITGVKNATSKLSSGQVVIMNCEHGQIYQER